MLNKFFVVAFYCLLGFSLVTTYQFIELHKEMEEIQAKPETYRNLYIDSLLDNEELRDNNQKVLEDNSYLKAQLKAQERISSFYEQQLQNDNNE